MRALLVATVLLLASTALSATPRSALTTHAAGDTALCADLDGDGDVTGRDIFLIIRAFGGQWDSPDWNPKLDLTGDGSIDGQDIFYTLAQFGGDCTLPVEKVPFETIEQGRVSAVRQLDTGLHLARNPEEWAELWAELMGNASAPPPLPPLDFEKEMVVGVVVGHFYAVTIQQVAARPVEWVVQAVHTVFGPGCFVPAYEVLPFHLIRLPRTELPFRLALTQDMVFCPPAFDTIDQGQNSGIGAHPPELRVALDAETWQALWAEHTADMVPPPRLPSVDFERDMVVGLFDAHASGGYDVTIDRVDFDSSEMGWVVEATHTAPGPGCPTPEIPTRPFHIVRLLGKDAPFRLVLTEEVADC